MKVTYCLGLFVDELEGGFIEIYKGLVVDELEGGFIQIYKGLFVHGYKVCLNKESTTW